MAKPSPLLPFVMAGGAFTQRLDSTIIGDEEDSHLGDFIEDKNAVLPLDAAIQQCCGTGPI